jgi:ribosomal protein S2
MVFISLTYIKAAKLEAADLMQKIAASGRKVLFVATKTSKDIL